MVTIKPKSHDYTIIVTFSGLHGTGKSTYARVLAKTFGLRHLSAGSIFRHMMKERKLDLHGFSLLAAKDRTIDEAVDERIKQEANRGDVVIDGQLAAWMAREKADIKIFLLASDRTRFERIAKRDKLNMVDARRDTLDRESIERERYKRYYNLNIDDLSIYDVVLNTELIPLNTNIELLSKIVQEFITIKKRKR